MVKGKNKIIKKQQMEKMIFFGLVVVLVFLVMNGGIGNGNGGNSVCTNSEEKCSGINDQMLLVCENGVWIGKGFVQGKCGYDENICIENGNSCYDGTQCCSGQCDYFQCVEDNTECTPGEERCSGLDNMMYQTCGSDGFWDNWGYVDGECGYPPETCKESGFSCINAEDCCSNQCNYFQCV